MDILPYPTNYFTLSYPLPFPPISHRRLPIAYRLSGSHKTRGSGTRTRCLMHDRKGDDGPASIFSSPFFPLFHPPIFRRRSKHIGSAPSTGPSAAHQSSIRYHDMGYAHASAFKLAVFCPLPSALSFFSLFPESIFAPRSEPIAITPM